MDEVEVENKAGTYPNLDDIVVEDDTPTILLPCIVCNKTFKPEALQRHSKVCEKNATKKRKTFDSFKQRVQGTDLAEFLPFSTLQRRVSVTEKPLSPKKSSSQWKEKHEAFVSAIRAARVGSGCEVGGSGEPRSSLRAPDHEQCPYCERHFGPKAFDRHQEWCREQHARHPPSVASQQAKERLEARIKYRAPPLKSKRALTREKYSPLVQRKARQTSPSGISNTSSINNGSMNHSASSSASSSRTTVHTSLLHQQELSNRLSRSGHSSVSRFQGKDNSSAPAFNRGVAARTSLRSSQKTAQRSVSPTKSNIGSSKVLPLSRSQIVKDDHRSHDGGCEDMLLSSCSVKKLHPGGRINQVQQVPGNQKSVHQRRPFNEETKPRQSDAGHNALCGKEEEEIISINNNIKNKKNDQKCSGNQLEEPYDPYASAERQMLELLHSDSACDISTQTHNHKNKKQQSSAQRASPSLSRAYSQKPSSLETSPTSAFTRYTKDLESSLQQTQQVPQIQTSLQSLTQSSPQTLPQILPQTPPRTPPQTPLLTSPLTVQQNYAQIPSSPKHKTKVEHQPESQTNTSPPQLQPLPPPRSFKRSASMQSTVDTLGFSAPRPQLQSFHSFDAELEANNNINKENLDNRPGTYDVESKNDMKRCISDQNCWVESTEQIGSRDMDTSMVQDQSNGMRSEVLLLDICEGSDSRKSRRETRESREIREINEKTCDVSEIDSLLEEVVQMQRSVSLLNATETRPQIQSSARSRRNRAGKMHIEDYLFPAELLRREEVSLSGSTDHFGHSSLVFGSTKFRRGSSKGRKLIEDMLFPTSGVDINANSDNNEDGDVIVSANALIGVCTPPAGFGSKTDQFQDFLALAPSPVALTSKVIDDDDDGLPRPKPLVSTRSSQPSIKTERTEPLSVPGSPTQLSTQQALNRQSTSSRLSADSAYSSLNRRSPVPHTRHQVMSGGSRETLQRYTHGADSPQTIAQQSLVLSSSSSESSLPPLTAVNTSRSNTRGKQELDSPYSERVSDSTPLLPKLSKFCHECGTRFPVSVAKFCHECGARRLEL